MQIDEITKRKSDILNVLSANRDFEVAAEIERQLWEDFIRFVAASDQPRISEMAKAVLGTSEINFPRW